jgi:hypothetical protein
MEITEIINLLKEVPIWAWIIFAIVITILFGDRELWEYEARFNDQNVGHGEFEIECKGRKNRKRQKKTVEVKLTLQPDAQSKPYEVLLNGQPVLSLSEADTGTAHVFVREKYQGEEPRPGDKVEIQHNHQTVLASTLHKD